MTASITLAAEADGFWTCAMLKRIATSFEGHFRVSTIEALEELVVLEWLSTRLKDREVRGSISGGHNRVGEADTAAGGVAIRKLLCEAPTPHAAIARLALRAAPVLDEIRRPAGVWSPSPPCLGLTPRMASMLLVCARALATHTPRVLAGRAAGPLCAPTFPDSVAQSRIGGSASGRNAWAKSSDQHPSAQVS